MNNLPFVERIKLAESGGRRYGADGKLLEGPWTRYGTAKGEMQVINSTNRDPGYGVVPARDNSPEERARVGRDYAEALLKEFGGDEVKAAAAYNWGPGNLRNAIAKHGDGWLDKAPAETKGYVTKVAGRSDGPTSQPASDGRPVVAPAADPVVAAAAPVAAAPPEVVEGSSGVVLSDAALALARPKAMAAPGGEGAWDAFLKAMPSGRKLAPADFDFLIHGTTPLAQVQNLAQARVGTRPDFTAFQAWKSRVA